MEYFLKQKDYKPVCEWRSYRFICTYSRSQSTENPVKNSSCAQLDNVILLDHSRWRRDNMQNAVRQQGEASWAKVKRRNAVCVFWREEEPKK